MLELRNVCENVTPIGVVGVTVGVIVLVGVKDGVFVGVSVTVGVVS